MKILYSQIKELVPSLSAAAQEVGEALTMTGFMMDNFQQVVFKGEADQLLSLEVRQNRADCLSVIGVAREVAAYYHLPLELPAGRSFLSSAAALPVSVRAVEHVKRILAVRLEGAANGASPEWLVSFLAFYDINSINLLVDLSNYIMLYTGFTSHLLDSDLVEGALAWEVNPIERNIQTLDGSELALTGGELVIVDDANVLALAGIVGCRSAAISPATKNLIAEMAVYDRFIIKQNSRALSVVTEASNRLSKDMSPAAAEYAFSLLIKLLTQETGAKIVGEVFDYYPDPQSEVVIDFNPELPGKIAGIDLSSERVREILENLRCEVEMIDPLSWRVSVPEDRLDLELAEDLAEEVIRLNRFDRIPSDQLPALTVTADITPASWLLKEKIRDVMVAWGYDEILSQPLVSAELNQQTNWIDWQMILTQNSVNEEFPALRQSVGTGLLNELAEYNKKQVWPIRIFEIGKVFGRDLSGVKELYSLGALWTSDQPALPAMQADVLRLLSFLGVTGVVLEPLAQAPLAANPFCSFAIMLQGVAFGILAQLKPRERADHLYYFELDLDKVLELQSATHSARELTGKLVVLDANWERPADQSLAQELIDLSVQAGESLWDLSIVDVYPLADNIVRYTLRAVYAELSDQEAKQLHARLFSLN
ncbi:MAG: phenylalanine--tRNA ligase beta subunit-related protein [Candidatus Falkowbacteria bacterium]